MESFGAVFRKCIEEKGIPTAQFSKEIDLNRGMLYNIWNSKKQLPEERLQALLTRKLFFPEQVERLREAYYSEIYGAEAFERLNFIRKALARLAHETPPSPMFGRLGGYAPTSAREIVTNESALLAVLYFVLRQELDGCESPRMETNYPFSCTEVDNLTYAMLSQYRDKSPEFRHCVMYETSGQSTLNLRNIFSGIRFFQMHHNLYGQLSDYGSYLPPGALYPCFFIMSRHVLLFHPERGNGLLLSDPEIVQTIALNAAQLHSNYTPIAQFPKDEMELQQLFSQKTLLRHNRGEFSVLPCLGVFTDRGMLGEILNPELPARNAFIDMLHGMYQGLRSDFASPHFHTAQGLEAFARTGKFQEMSRRIACPAPPEIRGELLLRLRAAIENGARIYLLDEYALPFPDGLSLEYFDGFLFVAGSISGGGDAFTGEFFKVADRQTTVKDFENFMDYILRNGFTYPREWTLNFLDELISTCNEA